MPEDRVDRRLAAIFAGDIAGYSRLMGADEEGTLRQLKAHRKELVDPKITEHRGRIVKTTGDGMLVEFVSVVDAVRCAVEIQRGMAERNAEVPADRRIEFRIGINVGDIISDGNDIYGDGVNVAARLEALAEPGGIMVSRDVHDQVRDKLELRFRGHGRAGGQEHRASDRCPSRLISPSSCADRAQMRPRLRRPNSRAADRPSIAVLPFVNMSGDPEQEYFADGISEDIITGLSKLRWFFVIARNSSFTYKGKAVDVKRVARELGVRYVLEGSVRKGGNRVRITAQLIDAATGNHHLGRPLRWRPDRHFRAAGRDHQESRRRDRAEAAWRPRGIRSQNRSPEDLGAWEMVIHANSLFWRMTKTEGETAIAMLEAGGRALSRLCAGAQHAGLHVAGFASFAVGAIDGTAGEAGGGARERARQNSTTAIPGRISRSATCFHAGDAPTRRWRIPACHRSQPELCRGSWLSRLGACARRSIGQGDHRILEQAMRMSPHDPQNAIFNVASLSHITSPVDTTRRSAIAARPCNSELACARGIVSTSRAWRRRVKSRRLARRWSD